VWRFIIESVIGLSRCRHPAADPDLGQHAADSLNAGWSRHGGWSSSPAAPFTITVLAFNLLGDGIRDILDPRLRGAV